MCEDCGCGKPEEFTLKGNSEIAFGEAEMNTLEISNSVNKRRNSEIERDRMHEHNGQWHSHDHLENSEKRKAKSEIGHEHTHEGIHEHDGHSHSHEKEIPLNIDILSVNNRLAERNRGFFEGREVLCFNLVSSPGSGKTTILEKTIEALKPLNKIFVIEGDQQTTRDADRIGKSGVPAVQINTGSGCHLDANMIHHALKKLDVGNHSILFIENVGNLVCPAMFDLGEKKRVVVISVTEGDDKPLKYPYMFQSSDLCIINKTDLLPYVDFNVETAMNFARQLNLKLEFILMSAKTGEGMKEWTEWIIKQF